MVVQFQVVASWLMKMNVAPCSCDVDLPLMVKSEAWFMRIVDEY